MGSHIPQLGGTRLGSDFISSQPAPRDPSVPHVLLHSVYFYTAGVCSLLPLVKTVLSSPPKALVRNRSVCAVSCLIFLFFIQEYFVLGRSS